MFFFVWCQLKNFYFIPKKTSDYVWLLVTDFSPSLFPAHLSAFFPEEYSSKFARNSPGPQHKERVGSAKTSIFGIKYFFYFLVLGLVLGLVLVFVFLQQFRELLMNGSEKESESDLRAELQSVWSEFEDRKTPEQTFAL